LISPQLDLQSENDELRNKATMPVQPSSNGATSEVWRKVSELQHENEWLKNKHRDEIQDLLTRIEEIEKRERIMPQPVAMTYETGTMPMSEQSSVSSSNSKKESVKAQRSARPPPSSQSSRMEEEGAEEELAMMMTYETGTMPMSEQSSGSSSNFKKEKAKAQRSAPPPFSSQSLRIEEEGEEEELAIKFKPKQTRAQRSVCCVYVKMLLRPFESRVRGGGGLGCSSEALPEAAAGVGPSSKGQ